MARRNPHRPSRSEKSAPSPAGPAAGAISSAPIGRTTLLALGIIFVAAAVVRVLAARDELWMDEIWTLASLSHNVHSPLEIFHQHHDNNHYLVSLWMYLVMPQQEWIVYRIPSVLAGIGTVALAIWIGRRWGSWGAIAAGLLTGSSLVLVTYGSEARGYALAGLFSLTAFLALERYLANRTMVAAVIFVAAVLLGTLSHLTFLQFYFGALVWSGVSLRRTSATVVEFMLRLAALHAVPLVFFAGLHFTDLREMKFGGGDSYVLPDVLARTATIAAGVLGDRPALAVLLGIGELTVAAVALVRLWREKSDLRIFLLAGFVAAPLLMFLVRPPQVLHERYFYLNILFFIMLLSFFIARVAERGRNGQIAASLLLAALVAANGAADAELLRRGRGHFLDLLTYVAEHTGSRTITISGDAEFAYHMYTEFYAPYAPAGHEYQVVAADSDPEWVIVTSQAHRFQPAPSIRDNTGREAYVLAEVFRHGGISGASFALYRQAASAAALGGQESP